MTDIHGQVAPGFEPVRDAFAENFAERSEIGSAFSAYLNGQKVVDLWGGEAAPGTPWNEDTLTVVWSATKGLTSYVVQRLVEQGKLDLDATISSYWPEFAANGKESITVRDALCHGARLPYPPGYSAVANSDSPKGWDNTAGLVKLLEQAEPVLAAGEHGYHALTFGLILGEIVQRATGQTIGTILADEVAGPLGLDTYIGLPASKTERVAELSLTIPPPPTDDPEILAMMAWAMGPEGPLGQALLVGDNGVGEILAVGNSSEFQSAEYPAASGITDARSLARVYGMLANGGSLDGTDHTSADAIAAHSTQQWRGVDATIGAEKRYAVGYMLAGTEAETFGPNPDAFGHPGMGGSLGFADPTRGIGFGYVTNHMIFEVAVDPRARALADALYACLD